MNNAAPRLVTIGLIADELGKPLHRVVYVLKTRAYLHPAAYAGRVRLFDRPTIDLVRKELEAIDARRSSQAVPSV